MCRGAFHFFVASAPALCFFSTYELPRDKDFAECLLPLLLLLAGIPPIWAPAIAVDSTVVAIVVVNFSFFSP